MTNTKKKCFFILISFIVLIFNTNKTFSQKFYISINNGYGYKTSSQTIPDFTNISNENYVFTEENIYVSLGKGYNAGLSVGYKMHENICLEIDVSYLFGSKSEARNAIGNNYASISSNFTRLIPSFKLFTNIDRIDLYAKFGLVFGSGFILLYTEGLNYQDVIVTEKTKLNGGFAFGLNAGTGISFNFNDLISVFSEINMINLSYAPKKGEVVEATYNGIDILPNMSTYNKEIEFVDIYTYNDNYLNPRKVLKYKFPYGSIGCNIGLRFNF